MSRADKRVEQLRQTLQPTEASPLALDLSKLSEYSTQELVQAVLKNQELGIQVIWQMLEVENQQYRNGLPPKIEAKILGVIAHDLANATDFDGQPVRTKETPQQLAQIIKISEVDELLVELDRWYSRKSKFRQEHILHQETIDTISHLVSLVDPEKKSEINCADLIAKLEVLAASKTNLEYKLVGEIVDLYYNLVQLIRIDPIGADVYAYWIQEINEALSWHLNEALALTIAKYHNRIFVSGGKNDFQTENKLIGEIMQTVPFPDNAKLKILFGILEDLRAVRYTTYFDKLVEAAQNLFLGVTQQRDNQDKKEKPIKKDHSKRTLMEHYLLLKKLHNKGKRRAKLRKKLRMLEQG